MGEPFFVGRERELDSFRSWIRSDGRAVLNVSGPGGVGKSALPDLVALAKKLKAGRYGLRLTVQGADGQTSADVGKLVVKRPR